MGVLEKRMALLIKCVGALWAVVFLAHGAYAAPVGLVADEVVNVGEVPQGAVRVATLRIHNAGDSELLLGPQIRTSCGCGSVQIRDEKVPAGKDGEVLATINFGQETKEAEVAVFCHTNDPQNEFATWHIRGKVVPVVKFSINPSPVLVDLEAKESVPFHIIVENVSGLKCNILSLRFDVPAISLSPEAANPPFELAPGAKIDLLCAYANLPVVESGTRAYVGSVAYALENGDKGQSVFNVSVRKETPVMCEPNRIFWNDLRFDKVAETCVKGTLGGGAVVKDFSFAHPAFQASVIADRLRISSVTLLKDGQEFRGWMWAAPEKQDGQEGIIRGEVKFTANGISDTVKLAGYVKKSDTEAGASGLRLNGHYLIVKSADKIMLGDYQARDGRSILWVEVFPMPRNGARGMKVVINRKRDQGFSFAESYVLEDRFPPTFVYVNEPFQGNVNSLECAARTMEIADAKWFIAWNMKGLEGAVVFDLDSDGTPDVAMRNISDDPEILAANQAGDGQRVNSEVASTQ